MRILIALLVALLLSACTQVTEKIREVPVGTIEDVLWRCAEERALIFSDEKCSDAKRLGRNLDAEAAIQSRVGRKIKIIKIFATDNVEHPVDTGIVTPNRMTKYNVYYKYENEQKK